MKTTNRTATPRMGPIARAVGIGGVGLGLALASAATSSAERVWDIGAYDSCMARIPTIMTPSGYDQAHWQCCRDSGGDYDHHQGKCVSPPAEADNVPGNTNPPPGQPRPPIASGGSVSDDPTAGSPKPRPTVVAPGPVG